MTVQRISDADEIRRIMTAPEVYPHISDDSSPKPEDFQPNMDSRIYYVGISISDSLEGLFMVVPVNAATLEVHTCFTRTLWGRSVEAALRAIQWVWDNTPFRRIITNVPTHNRLAARLAIRSGMVQFGTNAASFLKNGTLYDQLMFGISKVETCQQP